MKILHIATGFAMSFQGGITNYVRALAFSQYEQGDDVWVLGDTDPQKYPFHYVVYQGTLPPFTMRALRDEKGLDQIKTLLDREQFDIIHIHMVLGVDDRLYQVLEPYKYIVSLHDYYTLCPRIFMMQFNEKLCVKYDEYACEKCVTELDACRYSRAILDRIKKYFHINLRTLWQSRLTSDRYAHMKRMLEGAQVLLPVSTRVQEIFESSGIHNDYRVLHIGNITAENFPPYERKKRIAGDKIRIGMINPGKIKGRDLLCKLAKNIDRDKFEVHVFGSDGGLKHKFARYHIVYHGRYEQKELPAILSQIDVGLVMSIWEDNGPQVVMEFLNSRVPVIGTKMGGIPDFVNGHNGYLFDPYSPIEACEMIRFVNQELDMDLIEKWRSQIKRTVTPLEHFKKVQEVYRNVL